MKIPPELRLLFVRALAAATLLLSAAPSWALELVMVEQSICPYCKIFDAEVGNTYAETETGQLAPLRRINLNTDWPEDLQAVAHDRLTPTFILVDEGKEIGRLRGYPGRDEFWELLNRLLEKHNKP